MHPPNPLPAALPLRPLLQTIAGRRRYLPDINSKSGQKRAAAERKAKNTVAQVARSPLRGRPWRCRVRGRHRGMKCNCGPRGA